MATSSETVSGRLATRVILTIGVLYIVLAIAWPFLLSPADDSFVDHMFMVIMIGVPGLALLFAGLQLSRLDIRPELYSTIARWCLSSIGGMFVVLILYDFQPNDSLANPIDSVLLFTALASVAGIGIGVHDARAKTRARNAEEYSQKLQRYENIVEAADDGIYVVGADGRFSMVNPMFAEMTGYDRAEILNSTPKELGLYDDEIAAKIERKQQKILDGEQKSASIELTMCRKDSRGLPVQSTFVLLPTDDGYERIGILRDITDRKERERELEKQNERLDSFARLLAHELRNPVTIGQIYGRQLSAETDSEAVQHVTESFDRIEAMIDVLLMLAKGRKAIDQQAPVELESVAREVWNHVGASDMTLEITVDSTIQADETYIKHLFRNLFENAIEHGATSSQRSPDDTVKHRPTSNQPEADTAVEHGRESFTVTVGELPTGFYVADNGRGIQAEELEAVFETGYTTAAGNGGMGLGLAFVQKLAEVYEWECAVAESDSGGARFEFRNVTPIHDVTQ